MKRLLIFLSALLLLWACHPKKEEAVINVFAAASMQAVVSEMVDKYSDSIAINIHINSASSGTLARQIANGAPCDIYLSANKKWMNYLAEQELVIDSTRCSPATNTLVLISSSATTDEIVLNDLPQLIKRHLAIGDPAHVPAGNYAQEALQSLRIYNDLQKRIVPTKDVTSALRLVESGECDYGIVYRSNVVECSKVKVVASIPDSLHQAITYQAALINTANDAANGFLAFITHPDNQAIWNKHGFN